MQSIPKIGGHTSAAGGVSNSIERAREKTFDAMQTFASSPRQWFTRVPSDVEINKYNELMKQNPFPVYLHAPYLINMSSVNAEARDKSVECLVEHLTIANRIGAKGLVTHLGFKTSSEGHDDLDRVVECAKLVLKRVDGPAKLLLENASGSGKVGRPIEDMGYMFQHIESDRAGVCIDLAHSFEGGLYTVSKESVTQFVDALDQHIGLKNIPVLHVSDSKTKFDSKVDRHENIGEGYIGLEGFKHLTAETRLHTADWVMEVPGFDDEGPDQKNAEILRSLFES